MASRYLLRLMTRFTSARVLTAGALVPSGIALTVVSSFVSLIGIVGVIITTPTFCPESAGPVRCRAVGHNGAMLAAYGLVAAGVGGGLFAAGRLADPEA